MRVLCEEHDPHLLDVANIVEKSWSEVSEVTMCRCWVKSNLFPRTMSDGFNATFWAMKNDSKSDEVQALLSLLSELSFNVGKHGPLHVPVQETVTEDDVRYWLGMKEL